VEGVVDDVLVELEVGVEDVLAGGPAHLHAVGGGYPLAAGGAVGEPVEVFGVEQPRGRAGHLEPEERDPAVVEPHSSPGCECGCECEGRSRPGFLALALTLALGEG